MTTKTELTKESTAVPARAVPLAALQAQLNNNWKGVSEADRLKFAASVCQALNIPTPLNPFRFIDLSKAKDGSRVVFYAPAEAAQLIAEHKKISGIVKNKYLEKETNIYVVEVQGTCKGRTMDNIACLYVGGLTGEARANAMMKCATKAMRRLVFSMVGLSASDDDDLDRESKIVESKASSFSIPAQTEQATPIDKEESDTARIRVFQRLIGKNGLFEKNVVGAKQFIQEVVGKSFDQLNAWDCAEIEGAINREENSEEQETKPEIKTEAKLPVQQNLMGREPGSDG